MVGKASACMLLALVSYAGDWEKIWGPVQFVVVDNETGAVYGKPAAAANLPDDIYAWSGEPMKWTPLGKPAKTCVTAGWKPHNALYCLAYDSSVYRLESAGNQWKPIGGPVGNIAGTIYGGPDALLATAPGAPADIYVYLEDAGLWKRIGGPGKKFVVGKSSDNNFKIEVFGLSPDDSPPATSGIYQWVGGWYKRGGPAANVYASHNWLFATNPVSGDILTLSPTGWKRIGGPGKMFAVDGRGHVFGLSPENAVASTKGVYQWSGTPNKWKKIGGPGGQVYAGWDQLLFVTNPETGDLWHYRPACAAITQPPDFSKPIVSQKLKAISGNRNMVAILWDPNRPAHPAPAKQELESLLFGLKPSVRDWYTENSVAKMALANAGVRGWYPSVVPDSGHYWRPAVACEHGFIHGHAEKWTEAIKAAANEFNFAAYDANTDKELTPDELAVFILIPQNGSDGYGRPTAGQEVPVFKPLVVQGVKIPWIAEWYIGNPPDFGTALHESVHLVLGSPDMYFGEHWPWAAGAYSIADQARSTHLDPYQKLKLGWLKWKVADKDGTFTLKDVETQGDALILYNPKRGTDEYFILENRWRGSSYDAGAAVASGGDGVPSDGLAIWHIVENEYAYKNAGVWLPGGGWGRWVVRMVRANGGTPFDDSNALFSKSGMVVSDVTAPANLNWLGGPSGFRIRLLTEAGPTMQVEIRRACY